jgi:hypothetical protein
MQGFCNYVDIEYLYRAIKRSQPSVVKKYPNGRVRISSALFKDAQGVSVSKMMNRLEEEVISHLRKKLSNDKGSTRMKAVVKLTEDDVKEVNAIVVDKPSDDDKYHAQIHKSDCEIELDEIQAKQLANRCKFVFEDEDVVWTV